MQTQRLSGNIVFMWLALTFSVSLGENSSSRDELITEINKAICSRDNATVDEVCYKHWVRSYLHLSGLCQSRALSSCDYCSEDFVNTYSNSTFLQLQERQNDTSSVLHPQGSLKYSVLPILFWTQNVKEFCANPTQDIEKYINTEDSLPPLTLNATLLQPFIQTIQNNYETNKCATYDDVFKMAAMYTTQQTTSNSVLYFTASLFLLNNISLQKTCDSIIPLKSVKTSFFQWLSKESDRRNLTNEDFISEADLRTILTEITSSSHEDDHSHHDHMHQHRQRRSVSEVLLEERATFVSVEQIFNSVGVKNHESGATWDEFQTMCPLLLTYSLTGNCETNHSGDSNGTTPAGWTEAQKYGAGTVAVFLVSGLAFLGILIIPCLGHKYYDMTLVFFIAMGIGALLGDAILHLIPELIHSHEEEAEDQGDGHDHGSPITIMKLTLVFGVIYLFFLFESLIELYARLQKKTILSDDFETSSEVYDTALTDPHTHYGSTAILAQGQSGVSHGHSHGPTNSKLTAFMILSADAIHNFVDGLAIGASFANSFANGVSTSIAVFCHEVPHELGDFAVLLSAGMRVKKAMVLHVLSALPCFLGLYIAIPLSVNPEVQQWIFAVTAGMFIYLSLVSMVPSLKNATTQFPILTFAAQNIGIPFGFLFMFVLALFEGKIKV
jgi:zinc transporter ZupT